MYTAVLINQLIQNILKASFIVEHSQIREIITQKIGQTN